MVHAANMPIARQTTNIKAPRFVSTWLIGDSNAVATFVNGGAFSGSRKLVGSVPAMYVRMTAVILCLRLPVPFEATFIAVGTRAPIKMDPKET